MNSLSTPISLPILINSQPKLKNPTHSLGHLTLDLNFKKGALGEPRAPTLFYKIAGFILKSLEGVTSTNCKGIAVTEGWSSTSCEFVFFTDVIINFLDNVAVYILSRSYTKVSLGINLEVRVEVILCNNRNLT